MHLLFWLSRSFPSGPHWTGEHYLEALPTALYGAILLLSAIAYWILVHTIIVCEGSHSRGREAVGSDAKGKLSIVRLPSRDTARVRESVDCRCDVPDRRAHLGGARPSYREDSGPRARVVTRPTDGRRTTGNTRLRS